MGWKGAAGPPSLRVKVAQDFAQGSPVPLTTVDSNQQVNLVAVGAVAEAGRTRWQAQPRLNYKADISRERINLFSPTRNREYCEEPGHDEHARHAARRHQQIKLRSAFVSVSVEFTLALLCSGKAAFRPQDFQRAHNGQEAFQSSRVS